MSVIICDMPGSPVRGIDRYEDDDLPTITEEVLSSELSCEVHMQGHMFMPRLGYMCICM